MIIIKSIATIHVPANDSHKKGINISVKNIDVVLTKDNRLLLFFFSFSWDINDYNFLRGFHIMNNNRDPLYKVTNVLLLQMFRKSEVARASPSLLKRTTSATGNLPSELTRPHWIRAPRRVGVGGLPTWKTGRGRCYVLYRITKATRSPAVSNCSCALEKPTDPARCCCLPTLLLD